MSQTILVEDNEELEKIFSINLKTYCSTEVIKRKDAKDVIELLNILPTIDLIICRARVAGEYTAIEIIKYIQEQELNTDIIIIGECKEYKSEYLTLKDQIEWEELIQNAADVLGVDYEENKKKKESSFYPVDINYFYEINESPCDVYIRLKKDVSYEYVKRLYSNDRFEKEDIDRYVTSGLDKLYVHTDYKQYFTTYVTNKIIQKLENESLSLENRLETNSNAFSIIKEKVNIAGLDEESTELASASIKSMITAIDQTPVLSDLLKMLLSNKISYAYQKAHFLCLIGEFILSKQSWYTKKHLEIFAFCSFFSDITLKSKKQMMILEKSELDNNDLNENEKEEVLTHARDATRICKDHPDFSSYISIILTQHHGSMNGVGFFKDHAEELHPISKVFIIADQFVTTILDPDKPKNKATILASLKERFKEESFLKVIKILEQKID